MAIKLLLVDARVSNSITNLFHAIFLLTYFIFAAKSYIYDKASKAPVRFSGLIVIFFAGLFLMKLMAIYVHFYPFDAVSKNLWIIIAFGFVLLNYILIESADFQLSYKFLLMLFSFFLRHLNSNI